MKIRLQRSYKKVGKDGVVRTVFVYAVAGTKEQLAAYKEAMGDNYKETEDGTPLWFTTRCVGQSGNLIFTQAGKIVADMSAFDQAASLASQYEGALGAEIARQLVAKLIGNVGGNAQSIPATEASKLDS